MSISISMCISLSIISIIIIYISLSIYIHIHRHRHRHIDGWNGDMQYLDLFHIRYTYTHVEMTLLCCFWFPPFSAGFSREGRSSYCLADAFGTASWLTFAVIPREALAKSTVVAMACWDSPVQRFLDDKILDFWGHGHGWTNPDEWKVTWLHLSSCSHQTEEPKICVCLKMGDPTVTSFSPLFPLFSDHKPENPTFWIIFCTTFTFFPTCQVRVSGLVSLSSFLPLSSSLPLLPTLPARRAPPDPSTAPDRMPLAGYHSKEVSFVKIHCFWGTAIFAQTQIVLLVIP